MPTAKEIVQNKPLAGQELKQIIISDFTKMLDKQPIFNGIAAFGRVAYELSLKLHVDNPFVPDQTFTQRSRIRSAGELRVDPAQAAIEGPFPLAGPSDESLIVGAELSRNVESPNRVRVEHGIPIPVNVKDQKGQIHEKLVTYPVDQMPPEQVPSVRGKDTSEQVAETAGFPDAAAPDLNQVTIPGDDEEEEDDDEMKAFLNPANPQPETEQQPPMSKSQAKRIGRLTARKV